MTESTADASHVTAESVLRQPRRLSPASQARWRELPIHRYLDLNLDEQGGGYCRISMRTSERTLGGVGDSVHGGVLATLVDIASINAIGSLIEPDETMAGTAELNISYLRPALSAIVVAEGRVLKKGRSLVFVDVDCSDGQGALFAKGRVVYALRRRTAQLQS